MREVTIRDRQQVRDDQPAKILERGGGHYDPERRQYDALRVDNHGKRQHFQQTGTAYRRPQGTVAAEDWMQNWPDLPVPTAKLKYHVTGRLINN